MFTVTLALLNNHPKATGATFIALHCCKCSILLLVIIVDLLLYLIHKLNFLLGMSVWRGGISRYTVRHCAGFRVPAGGLGVSPVDKGRLL